jgi:ABC-type antimicrobial peptide transport system permease subunit
LQELSLRLALGASRSDILRLVVTHGLQFALAGVVLGIGAAVLASERIQPLLFRQSATDPRVYAAVGLTMIVVALAATALPALRATRADPNAALRAE